MNVYILTDMEGISLATEWDQVKQGHPYYPRYQAILAQEVGAAVEGALAAGATRIVINDGHGSQDYNLLWDRLNPMVEIERPDCPGNILPSLKDGFDAMMMIGYHAMEGTPNAVMAHTQNHLSWASYAINGTVYGEIGQMSLIAGHFGVPVAYVSGDRAAVEEARGIHGDDLPATIVKWGFENGKAVSLHPAESAARIRRETERALRLPKRSVFTLPAPYEITVTYKSPIVVDESVDEANRGYRLVDEYTAAKTRLSAKDILT